MNKKITLLLLVTLLISSILVFADDNNTADVNYHVDSGYTWEIHTTIDFGSNEGINETVDVTAHLSDNTQAGVRVTENIIPDAKKLVINIDDNQVFTISSGNTSLNYVVKKTSNGDALTAGANVLEVLSGTNTGSQPLYFTLTTGSGTAEVAGTYTGTITYSARIEENLDPNKYYLNFVLTNPAKTSLFSGLRKEIEYDDYINLREVEDENFYNPLMDSSHRFYYKVVYYHNPFRRMPELVTEEEYLARLDEWDTTSLYYIPYVYGSCPIITVFAPDFNMYVSYDPDDFHTDSFSGMSSIGPDAGNDRQYAPFYFYDDSDEYVEYHMKNVLVNIYDETTTTTWMPEAYAAAQYLICGNDYYWNEYLIDVDSSTEYGTATWEEFR